MKREKIVHEGYKEWERSGKAFEPIFDKYQYIFSSPKGKISLVHFLRLYEGENWEIYCLEGDLFEDVIRFPTQHEAETKCLEFLE